MKEEKLAFNLEGVIGDFLDDYSAVDLPYDVIEDLAKHVAGWVLIHEKEIFDTYDKLVECHRKLMKR